ncbi:oligosaccharide flippase family protein [bacterium]|nr:oligosaccharide flippase family protein [bacterium]MBU1957261.1 oligosaccharide flippase family protein [bacterium]
MLKKLKPKSEFSRNVLTLMTGTTIAQAIPIAISPILTRIYTPEDFGLFALYISIAAIISVVATGRYELAIMLPKKDGDAANIVVLSFLLSFLVSFISFLIVFIFNTQLANLLGNPEISSWLYFIPITVLLTGVYQSFNYWSNRKKQYKRLATSRVVQSGVTATTNLGMGFNGFGSSGLLIGTIAGQMIATTVLAKMVIKEDITIFKKVKKIKIFALARRYVKFPKFDIWSALFNTSSSSSPIILLGIFFNSAVVGFYSLSYRILSLPIAFISSSIAQVFLEESSKVRNNKEKLHNLTQLTFKKLFYLGLFPMILIGVYGDYAFYFIFGEKWKIAGEYAQVLSIWLFFVFLISPLSTILITLEKQKEALYFNILMLTSRILALCLGYYIFNDAFKTIILFTCVGTFFWIGMMLYIFKLVNIKLQELYFLSFLAIISIVFFSIIRRIILGEG